MPRLLGTNALAQRRHWLLHCGEVGRISKITREKKRKNRRTRIYQCLACGKQFSATSGMIFNDTHLPVKKWFMAIAVICEAKRGIFAIQLDRHLEVDYRTAWHLAHRIREAMQDGGSLLTDLLHVPLGFDKTPWPLLQ